jgi:hypothetical protein
MVRRVSNSKLENVVYPPMKPIGIRYLQYGLHWLLSVKKAKTIPIRKDPVMLMTKVP